MLARTVATFAFAYFLSYVFRVVNAVAGPGLVADIGIDAAALGLLTSTYFLTFAAAQLPLGVALDRYGPRRVESILFVVAALGALTFALSNDLTSLIIGRGLIGLGVSAALMASFKAYAMVAPPRRLHAVTGIHMAAGGLGALAAGAPSELAISLIGWRGLFIALAILCLAAAASVALFGPRWHGGPKGETLGRQIRAVGRVMADPLFLRVMAFCVPSQATALATQGLWAGPWLRDVQGLDPAAAATVLSLMAVAMIAGYLVNGAIAAQAQARRVHMFAVPVTCMTLYMVAQAGIIFLPVEFGAVTWCVGTFFATSGILLFPILASLYPGTMSGRVNTVQNFLVFIASFAVQWLIGVALDTLSPGIGVQNAYNIAFGALLALQAIGLALIFVRMPAHPPEIQPTGS